MEVAFHIWMPVGVIPEVGQLLHFQGRPAILTAIERVGEPEWDADGDLMQLCKVTLEANVHRWPDDHPEDYHRVYKSVTEPLLRSMLDH